MKRLLGMLLVLAVVSGCGSKKNETPASTPAKTPDAAAVKKRMTPAQRRLGDPVVNSVGMVLVPIPAGEFMMGHKTTHPVKITKPFHLGAHEVTQGQYEKMMGKNPSHFQGAENLPVETVSWEDAVEFCRKLSALPEEIAGGRVYRLPTEAEWEYACRAGTTTKFSFGDDASQFAKYAWYDGNSDDKMHSVGEKKPNAWGLYDMHGNVWEWCHDWYGNYPSGSVTDPTGPKSRSNRVLRGGSWYYLAKYCQSGFRIRNSPRTRSYNIGFRVAQVPLPVKKPASGAMSDSR